MKILLVSWYFPPCNTMGALRIGKLAKYLVGRGHDVRVVCARDQPFAMTLPVEVPAEIVRYSRWRDVNAFPAAVQRLRVTLKSALGRSVPAAAPATGSGTGTAGAPTSRSLRLVLTAYQCVTNIPDSMVGWLRPAIRSGRAVTADWTPDVVFASAPPFTTLFAGRAIARRCGAPLVVEYRDRWIEDPYGQPPAFRRWLDRAMENWCVRPASGVVTVSEPWAEDYRKRWGKPVVVAYNGFDPDDIPAEEPATSSDPDVIRILYTGILYPERRDPTPLFEALSGMGEERRHFRVDFYGANVAQLEADAARHGIGDIVRVFAGVPFTESLRLQREADVLLLLQWNHPLERGNVPGKLFEYLAARRPVLGIGYEGGVPAGILRERQAGEVMNDPGRIADFLRARLAAKRRLGTGERLPDSVPAGLSRPEQYRGIEELLESVTTPRADG